MNNACIAGVGGYVPEKVLTSAELEKRLGLEAGWIEGRTGVAERRIAGENQATSDLAAEASRAALADAGVLPGELDGIIVATTVPDTFCPSAACRVQAALGAERAWAFDVNSASSGFIAALVSARAFIESGAAETILVAGAEVCSRFVDWGDPKTCVLFGDGAGAVVLRKGDSRRVVGAFLGARGADGGALAIPGGGTALPPSERVVKEQLAFLRMDGGAVFRFAKNVIGETVSRALESAGLSAGDADLVVPHQSNVRIIDEAAKLSGIPREKFYVNMRLTGNTSAASVPLALSGAYGEGLLKSNSTVVLVSYGAGLSFGAAVVKW